ncbi:MAG: IMPACT family protein [Candidatus Kapaibacterium sp.]
MSETQDEDRDRYFTIAQRTRAERKVLGSRFIATAFPVNDKDDAKRCLADVSNEFFDATHHCYAYRLGIHGWNFRTADDGEPSGTAGKPILFALQKASVSDVLLVVSRYFGGTKLGRGGLARAYAGAAEDVLALCQCVPVYRTVPVKVFCTYEDVQTVLHCAEKHALRIESDYHDSVHLRCHVRESDVESFVTAVDRATNARAGCVVDTEMD